MSMSEAAPRATPLRAVHESLGATMTAFAGWLMPLRYAGEISEHQARPQRRRAVRPVPHGRDRGDRAAGGRRARLCPGRPLVRAGAWPRQVHDDLRTGRRRPRRSDRVPAGGRRVPGRRERRQHRHGGRGAPRPRHRARRTGARPDRRVCADRHPGAACRRDPGTAGRHRSRRREVLLRVPVHRGRAARPACPHRLHRRGRFRAVHRIGRRGGYVACPGRGRGRWRPRAGRAGRPRYAPAGGRNAAVRQRAER